MKSRYLLLPLFACAQWAHADVYVLDSDSVKLNAGKTPAQRTHAQAATGHAGIKSGKTKHGVPIGHYSIQATGSSALVDASGVKYFINTNITFSTTSSASAAMSEASYTHAVAATTLNGGTVSSTLNDAFDGYNTMCLSLNNTVANCATGNANYVIYNKNGAAATSECTGATSGVNRQIVFPVQNMGNGISAQRKVFVPDNDSFARWQNIFTNTGSAPVTMTMVVSNNLGSDANTVITGDSSGNTSPTTADTWITSFQNYSGTTSSDPRLGHVLQGAGATTHLAGLNFVNGDDNPYWGYTISLNPGQSKTILNFVAVQPSKAAAASKAASLAALTSPASLTCMSTADRAAVVNFAAAPPAVNVPAPALGAKALALLGLLVGVLGFVGLRRARSH